MPTPRPVRRVEARTDFNGDLGRWPFAIPAVRQLLSDGLDLGQATVLVGENGSGKSTMHGLYTYLEDVGMGSFHELSHGKSFLQLIQSRAFGPHGPRPGLYLFDEVESALSFTSSLRVLATRREVLTQERAQVVLATHSPILAALPGATILELTDDGFREAAWEDLDLVINERYFLADPQRFLRHLQP